MTAESATTPLPQFVTLFKAWCDDPDNVDPFLLQDFFEASGHCEWFMPQFAADDDAQQMRLIPENRRPSPASEEAEKIDPLEIARIIDKGLDGELTLAAIAQGVVAYVHKRIAASVTPSLEPEQLQRAEAQLKRADEEISSGHWDNARRFLLACLSELRALTKNDGPSVTPSSSVEDKVLDDPLEYAVGCLGAIMDATTDGRVCDDVAWFDTITTLYDYCHQALTHIRSLTRTGTKEPPDGWVMVPKEPTETMVAAGMKAAAPGCTDMEFILDYDNRGEPSLAASYTAMIAAAPSPRD